ncbi:MAG TPA: thiolase family protein [Syntrophales bacterium]|nr:thiolase family protein [Syntrophales bacterium]HOM07558.1 thiolase family protein [Syntrophales bacterium]
MNERVAIVGVAQSRFAPRRPEVNYAELAYEVISRVLEETGLSLPGDIDNAVSCSHDIWDGQTISDIGITDVIGGHLRTEEKMAMDGSTAVFYGAAGILSGEYSCTLLLAHTKMSQTNRNIVNNVAFDPIYTRMLGFDYTSAAALQARRYLYKYGLKREDFARVVVKNLRNALLNPCAWNGREVTVSEVLSSPPVAPPIHRLDMAPDTDGAVAMILASEERARAITDRPVWILGMGTSYDAHYLGDRDLADVKALREAAARAYAMAGIRNPRRDVDLVEVGEEFSYQELLWIEGLGLCGRGEAARLTASGATAVGGSIPVNPSGGLLSGVPINVAGLNRVAEAVIQLRGEAGERQVKGAQVAVAQGHSGFCGQHQCVVVLGT